MTALAVDVRTATRDDAATIAAHRVAMFADMGELGSDAIADELRFASVAALYSALADGSYAGWLACDASGTIIRGAGVHVKPHLPRETNDGRVAAGPVPLVVNVYTQPGWRGCGVARVLMAALMDWSRKQGFDRVVLHASDAGLPLYEKIGFKPTNEIGWTP